jgi:ribose-phosphate pyrophosphokinase
LKPSTPPVHRGRLSIVACNSGKLFASRVEKTLVDLIEAEDGVVQPVIRQTQEITFANGEVKTVVEENIRGDDVYVFQCLDDPQSDNTVNDNLMALVTALNAVYQSDPDRITAVIPQFPYSRQERKKAREPITARLVASLLESAGADRVITLDIHAEAIEGFFQRAILEDLHASKAIIEWIEENISTKNLCIVAPDTGGADMARYYSNQFRCALAVVDKARDYSKTSVVESMRLVGDVEGKRILMPDDLIATGGTLINACRLLKEHGAAEIYLACSLPFFNGNAPEKLDKAHKDGLFEVVVGTDAVIHGDAFFEAHPWYREVSVADLFGHVLFNINRKRSVSALLK